MAELPTSFVVKDEPLTVSFGASVRLASGHLVNFARVGPRDVIELEIHSDVSPACFTWIQMFLFNSFIIIAIRVGRLQNYDCITI